VCIGSAGLAVCSQMTATGAFGTLQDCVVSLACLSVRVPGSSDGCACVMSTVSVQPSMISCILMCTFTLNAALQHIVSMVLSIAVSAAAECWMTLLLLGLQVRVHECGKHGH
jgi:hypothetical protein